MPRAIQEVTIPSLELTGATISVHPGEILREELDENLNMHYHTDSIILLQYIGNNQK